MPRYFTHYWLNSTWWSSRQSHAVGDLLEYIGGNVFTKRRIEIGDTVYVITVLQGRLYLCGKLVVGQIVEAQEAAKYLGRDARELWQASEHVLALKATPMRFDLAVPLRITSDLRCVNRHGFRSLKFVHPGKLDQQTLRTMRELDASSALKLDELLPPMKKVNRRG